MIPGIVAQAGSGTSGGLPAAGNPDFSNVVLLSGFEGTDGATSFDDESAVNATITAAGNAQIDTSEAKFGSSSLLLDGTGDYVSFPDNVNYELGGTMASVDFTAEAWVYLNTSGTSIYTIFSKRPTSGNATEWQLAVSNGNIVFTAWRTGGIAEINIVTTLTIPRFGWCHIAVMRQGSDFYVFLDGEPVGNATAVNAITTSSNPLAIGRDRAFGRFWLGWIDEVRISREAFYPTTGFIPPTAAFPRS